MSSAMPNLVLSCEFPTQICSLLSVCIWVALRPGCRTQQLLDRAPDQQEPDERKQEGMATVAEMLCGFGVEPIVPLGCMGS